MSEETKVSEETPKKSEKKKAVSSEQKYSRQDYIDNAEALGYPKYVVIGAFYYSNKDELTEKEFESLVNKFLYN